MPSFSRACIAHRHAPNVAHIQDIALAIQSPCILVCSIDMKTGFCFGCGRTRDEIGAWIGMTDAQRTEVMAELPARLETVERKPRRETRRTRMAREREAGAE